MPVPAISAVAGIVLTIVAGYGFARLLPVRGLLDRLIAGAVLCPALIVANALLLSALGHFFARPGLLVLAVLEAAIAVWRVCRSPRAMVSLSADLSRLRRGITGLGGAARRHPVVAVLCAVLVLLYAWRTFVGVVVGVRDYDGLWYHLVTTMAFVHEHRVGVRIPFNVYSDAYAPNVEIITAWLVLLYGTSLFASVTQVPFALLGGLATTAIARRCGLSKGWSVAAGCLFLLTPIVVDQLSRQYNDIAVAALIVAAMHLGAVVVTDRTLGPRQFVAYVALTGTVLGLALGSKASAAAVTALLAVAVLVSLVLRVRKRELPLHAGLQGAVVGAVALLVLGAPYYVRDLVIFGNPLEPFSYHVGPIHLEGPLQIQRNLVAPFRAPGISHLPAPVITLLVWSGHPGAPGAPVDRLFGYQWFVFWPCMAALTIWSVLARRHGYYLLVFAASALSVLTDPVAWWGRYTIYVIAPAAVAALWLLETMRRRSPGWSVAAHAGLVGLAAVAIWQLPGQFLHAPAGVPNSHFGPGTGEYVPAGALIRSVLDHDRPVVQRASQYRWLLHAPAGIRILVTKDSPYFIGPLYGQDGSNAVVLVTQEVAPGGLASVMRARDLDYAWLPTRGALSRYASEHSQDFQLVGQGGGASAYRLRSGQGRREPRRLTHVL